MDSAPGQGSTFKIYLPRIAAPAVRPILRPVRKPSPGTESVLVVEDDERIRRLAVRVLTSRGYEVRSAANSEEALAVAGAGAPLDLLITDVVLPGLSGRELAEKLIAQNPDLRVLFMSGYTDDAIIRYGVLELGVAFLQKPFTPAALLERLRETLDADAAR